MQGALSCLLAWHSPAAAQFAQSVFVSTHGLADAVAARKNASTDMYVITCVLIFLGWHTWRLWCSARRAPSEAVVTSAGSFCIKHTQKFRRPCNRRLNLRVYESTCTCLCLYVCVW